MFLDTVGLLALWDTSDQWNMLAASAMVELMKRPCETVTSDAVLLECGNAASRRPYRGDVNRLRLKLAAGQKLLFATPVEIEDAWNAYDRREAAGASIVDHISFGLMRRLRITEAFTNDEHFRAAGFVTLF